MKLLSLFVALMLQCAAFASQNIPMPADKPANADEWHEQMVFFQENGYLWVKNFFSAEDVDRIQKSADEINTESQSILSLMQKGELSNFFESLIVVPEMGNPLQVCRAEDLLGFSPDLNDVVESGVTTYLENLLNEPYVSFKDKLNFKWPGGGAFPPHQDFPAFEYFAPREHITAMVPIDHATVENGCLYVAKDWRGTFADDPTLDLEMLDKGQAVLPYIEGGSLHGSIQPQYVEKIEWLTLYVSPGDLVIFDSYLPHYSEPNASNVSCRAMFFTYSKLSDGEYRQAYYDAKRYDPQNPAFHFATPTNARTKEGS